MKSNALCQDIQNRSNLPLQISLWLNVYVYAAWSLTYGFYILYKLISFWKIENLGVMAAYLASNIFEFIRLHSGYSGNLKANPMHLNRFLILTPLILLPLFLFLLISAKAFNLAISSLTYTIFGLMGIEFIFGVYTWKNLCAYQSQIYKLKREMIIFKAPKLNHTD